MVKITLVIGAGATETALYTYTAEAVPRSDELIMLWAMKYIVSGVEWIYTTGEPEAKIYLRRV